MLNKIRLCLLVVLFGFFVASGLYGNLEKRFEERFSHDRVEKREKLQNGSRALLKLFNPMSGEMVITERVFQLMDWYLSDWINWDRELFFYDNDVKLSSVPLYYWDDFSDQWYDSNYRTYISWNNDLIESITLRYEEDSLEYERMTIYQTYNDNEQVIEVIWEEYDDFTQEVVYESIYQFLYDNEERIEAILTTENTPQGSSEMNIYITYDDEGRMQELIDEVSIDGQSWWLNERTVIEYHPSDESNYSEVQSFFNYLALYIAFDNVTWLQTPMFDAQYFYFWFNNWILEGREVYSYAQDNNLETILLEAYMTDNHWEPMDRYCYLYNDQGLLEELLRQSYYQEWEDQSRMLITMDEHSDTDDGIVQTERIEIANYPNPFNPETTIRFQLNFNQPVNLSIMNIKGQRVRTLINDYREAGEYRYIWDGKDDNGNLLPSGIYIYSLAGEVCSVSGKMLLLK